MLQDNIFKSIIEVSASELYSNSNEVYSKRLLSKHERLRSAIIRSNSKPFLLVKSMFLIFSNSEFDLLDIIIFNSMINVQIEVLGTYEYLNNILRINYHFENSRDKFFLKYDSKVFELKKGDKIRPVKKSIPENITIYQDQLCTRKIRRHLLNFYKKYGIGFLSAFEGIDTSSIQSKNFKFDNKCFISTAQIKNTLELQSDTKNDDDVKIIDITDENLSLYFDIDGISGFAGENEVLGLKSLFDLNYSLNNHKKPISKAVYFMNKGNLLELKNLITFHIGQIDLPGNENARIDIFLVFSENINKVSKREEEKLRLSVYNTLFNEVQKTIESSRLKNYNSQFRKAQMGNSQSQPNDLSKSKSAASFQGKGDKVFLKNILNTLNSELKKYKAQIFFESYSTKSIFTSKQLSNVVIELNRIFDLLLLNLRLDACCNIGINGIKEHIICTPNNFIDKGYNVNCYSLFNCSEIATYNGITLRRSKENSKSKFIKIFANGLGKVNIYCPLLTQYLPRSFRAVTFPLHTATYASCNLYNWSPAPNNKKIVKKLISDLEKAKDGMLQRMCLDVDMRAEFRISSVNLCTFDSFIKKILIKRRLNYCSTQKLIYMIEKGIESLVSQLKDSTHSNIEGIARLGINEIYFFEKYFRGGSNLHILPSSLKSEFIGAKSTRSVETNRQFNNLNLSFLESSTIVKRLIEHNNKLSEQVKTEMNEFISVVEADYHDKILCYGMDKAIEYPTQCLDSLVSNLISSLCRIYKFSQSSFYVGNDEANRYNTTEISHLDLISFYFTDPPIKMKQCLYYGIYNYLKESRSSSEVEILILKHLKAKNIKYIAKATEKNGMKIRKIGYTSLITDSEITELKRHIKEGIEPFSSNKRRSSNTTLSEHLLIYYGLHCVGYQQSSKKMLYDDLMFPFWMYTNKSKLERSYSKYKEVENKSKIIFSDFTKKININYFSLEQLVEFLNTNNSFIKNNEVLKSIDKIHQYSRGKIFVSRSDEYYTKLFRCQYEIPPSFKNYMFMVTSSSSDLYTDTTHFNKYSSLIKLKHFNFVSELKNDLLVKDEEKIGTSNNENPYSLQSYDEDFVILESQLGSEYNNSIQTIVDSSSSSEEIYVTPKNRKMPKTNSETGREIKKKKCCVILPKIDKSPSKNDKSESLTLVMNAVEQEYLNIDEIATNSNGKTENSETILKLKNLFSEFSHNMLEKEICSTELSMCKPCKSSEHTEILKIEKQGTFKNPSISLFCIIPDNHFIISERGKTVLSILKRYAKGSAKKVFINYCLNLLSSRRILFYEMVEFLCELERRNYIEILKRDPQKLKIRLKRKCYWN